MVQVHKPIVKAWYTDADHDHAKIILDGEPEPRIISKREDPHMWSEMLRSVVLVEFNKGADPADATATTPGEDLLQKIAAIEADIKASRSAPPKAGEPTAQVDAADLAVRVAALVQPQIDDLTSRVRDLEGILRNIYSEAKATVEKTKAA